MIFDLTKETTDEIISANDRVVIKFYADWCSPCKILAPMFEGIADEMSEVSTSVVFSQINTDADPELAQKYEVSGLPTVIVVDNGEVVARETGIPRINALLQKVRSGAVLA